MANKKKISNHIEDFLDAIDSIKASYNISSENVNKCDSATQDLLHQLEFGDYDSRGKAATKLAHVRQARRKEKDFVEMSGPLIELIRSQEGIVFTRKLRDVLGKVRKEEERKENRFYVPRVINDLDFLKDNNNTQK